MKTVEFAQTVAIAINHTTWNIPRICEGSRWRNISKPDLVINPRRINGHDHFEEAIFRLKDIMARLGWRTEISTSSEQCHEHLSYQHYRLTCRK
ncbi:MAG: hypothetical protein ABIL58_14165 [Pseudomonadota bacterium]